MWSDEDVRGLVVLVIAACGGPTFDDGDFRCGPAGECPPGFACREGACRRTSDAPASDATQLVDAAIVDAAGPDADPSELCTARYGGASGFLLCRATSTECEFYAVTNESSCDAFCTAFGGACIGSYDEGSPSCTAATTDQACIPLHTDQICVCTP